MGISVTTLALAQAYAKKLASGKVSISEIVDDLITNASDKPLSAARGYFLKKLIDELDIGKLDAKEFTDIMRPGTEMAEALLYIGADGNVSYLKLGDNLKIKDGTLMVIIAEPICGKALCGEIKCGG